MNQKDFYEELFKTNHFRSKQETKIFVEIFMETLKKSLIKEKKLVLNNFGTFKIIKTDKNIHFSESDETIKKEYISIKFKASDNIKKLLKENEKNN